MLGPDRLPLIQKCFSDGLVTLTGSNLAPRLFVLRIFLEIIDLIVFPIVHFALFIESADYYPVVAMI